MPFVLFFEGLARAEATQAAFIQKTLVVWVALLAVPLLRERFGVPHALAIVLLIAGQAWLAGHAGTVAFGAGEAMILAATLLWAVEVVYREAAAGGSVAVATLAAARMGFGTVLLLGWVAVSGRTGAAHGPRRGAVALGPADRAAADRYVATWYAALARAQAIDVTAVLVFGAVVTALLSGAADGAPVSAAGTSSSRPAPALVAVLALRRRPRRGRRVTDAAGPLLFARYAYPPNALGLCGADSAAHAARVRRRARVATAASPSSRARSTARGPTSS